MRLRSISLNKVSKKILELVKISSEGFMFLENLWTLTNYSNMIQRLVTSANQLPILVQIWVVILTLNDTIGFKSYILIHRNYLNSAHKKKLKSMGLLIVMSLL